MATLPKQRTAKIDIEVTDGGGVGFFGIYGESTKGVKWCKANVQGYSTLMCPSGVAYTDQMRMAADIIQAALDAGLRVQTPCLVAEPGTRIAEAM